MTRYRGDGRLGGGEGEGGKRLVGKMDSQAGGLTGQDGQAGKRTGGQDVGGRNVGWGWKASGREQGWPSEQCAPSTGDGDCERWRRGVWCVCLCGGAGVGKPVAMGLGRGGELR